MPELLSHCLVENCPERHMTSLDCCMNEREKKIVIFTEVHKTKHAFSDQLVYWHTAVKIRNSPHSVTSHVVTCKLPNFEF